VEILKLVIANLLPVVGAILVGVAPLIVHMVVRHLQKRLDFEIAEKDEKRLSDLVVEGIHFAEEEARGKIKMATRTAEAACENPAGLNLNSIKGQKEGAAVRYILGKLAESGYPEKTAEWATKAVRAALGKLRMNGTALVLLLIPLALFGCSMTTAQRLSLASNSAYQLKESVAPTWSGVCEARAKKCVSDGVTKSQDCKPWVSCQAALKRFYQAHHLVQVSVLEAARWLLSGDESMAKKILATATAAFAEAMKLAKGEGLIKGGTP